MKADKKNFRGVVTRYSWHDARWFAVIGFAPYVIAFAGMVTSSVSYFGCIPNCVPDENKAEFLQAVESGEVYGS